MPHLARVFLQCAHLARASMADEHDRSISLGEGDPLLLRIWAELELDPETYGVLYNEKEDPRRDAREHLLARISPRELVFIEYVCRHPEQTDEEIMSALGLRASTMLAYYAHLGRNFNVRNSDQLRRWALKNHLVDTPEDGTEKKSPDPGFDPWVRWY